MEMTPLSEVDYEEEFDFNSPEDVLIEVVGPHDGDAGNTNWDNWSIETCSVINGVKGVIGAASYEHGYGCGLEYMVQSLIDFSGAGWFVVGGITGDYVRGDGWTTDDDMTFYCHGIRPATKEEIENG